MFENHSQGLNTVKSYMSSMTSSGDLNNALGSTAIVFKVAVFIVMVIGGLALAIWTFRIGMDILSLALPKSGFTDKISAMGTGKADSYEDVMAYIKDNGLNTLLMLTLIVFLMTGWIFQIAGLVMTGAGMLINKIVGIDVEGSLAKFDAESFSQKAGIMRPAQLKQQYDANVGAMRSTMQQIYETGGADPDPDDPRLKTMFRTYTMNFVKADLIGKQAKNHTSDFKVPSGYFEQHLIQGGTGVCDDDFLKNAEINDIGGVTQKCGTGKGYLNSGNTGVSTKGKKN